MEKTTRDNEGSRGVLLEATDKIEKASLIMENLGEELEDSVKPFREGIIKRHPTLFMLLATTGFVSTMTGIEQILVEYQLFGERPWLVLLFGIFLLFLTGTLYKKLG